MWDPLPMTVHEWGVNTFDWDSSKRLDQKLPDYLYTDKKPGKSMGKPELRVRDMPADSGVRTKPILYFYPTSKFSIEKPPKVGVEMRFAYGYANAWWPQVNLYRDAKMSAAEKAPDWNKWKTELLEKYKKMIRRDGKDPKAVERWEKELAQYEKLDHDAQIAWLANRFRWHGESDFPEDKRMQLAWEKLTLHENVPEGQTLPGEGLPDDHWVKVAREVDAAYVSNGKESERYVFYEGATREKPAIAVMPLKPATFPFRQDPKDPKELAIVNVGEHPIYDVTAVYRDSKKGILWTASIGTLPVGGKKQYSEVDQTMALRVPDFSKPGEGDNVKLEAVAFEKRMRDQLIENLTAGHHFDGGGVTMRDPADPQGPTTMHQLYKKEAVSLEKIWHQDFYQAEGLTVIYRESPAYLDEAMPLNIFTSMYSYVKLSRCGLVLNRNIPIDGAEEISMALRNFEIAQYNKTSEEELAKMVETLKGNQFLTLGMARYRYGQRVNNGWDRGVNTLEKVEALFE